MNGRTHDILRQGRVLWRHIKYSSLLTGGRRPEKVQAALERVFRATNTLLHESGVEYWLVYGTLLGYYRDGGFIRGDRDIDFGAHEKEYEAIWEARHRLPEGFTMYDTSHRHFGPKLYVVCDDWEADIYFYRDRDGLLQSYEKSRNLGDMQPFPREYVYPLKPALFLGESVYIPNNPLAYLLHTYRYIGTDGVRDPETGYWHPPATP